MKPLSWITSLAFHADRNIGVLGMIASIEKNSLNPQITLLDNPLNRDQRFDRSHP